MDIKNEIVSLADVSLTDAEIKDEVAKPLFDKIVAALNGSWDAAKAELLWLGIEHAYLFLGIEDHAKAVHSKLTNGTPSSLFCRKVTRVRWELDNLDLTDLL